MAERTMTTHKHYLINGETGEVEVHTWTVMTDPDQRLVHKEVYSSITPGYSEMLAAARVATEAAPNANAAFLEAERVQSEAFIAKMRAQQGGGKD